MFPAFAILVAGASLVLSAPDGAVAAALGCVIPGNDGPNPNLTGVVNTYYPATASAAAGATSISVGARIPGAAPNIAPGDLLLVIQMQDADISGTNAVTYGDGATGQGSTALNSTGLYEYVKATSAVTGGVVNIAGLGAGNGLINSYDFSLTVTATHGFRTFQVIRVPQYSSATLGAGLTAAPWDGALHAGGVLAVDVAGALNLNTQTVSVDQLGFKGALGVQQTGGPDAATDWVTATQRGDHGYKGEGIAGTPHFLYDAIGNAAVNSGADGYPSGDAARGAPGTAGGGGTDADPIANDQNSGGGGGANGGQGGLGGNTWNSNLALGGHGGAAFPASVSRVVLGGGGGSGSRNNSAGLASSGGTGGGIVMIRTGSLAGTGTITANGGVGVTPANDGGGGGGAGGSVVVTTNTGNVNGLTIHANGGNGTDAWPTGPTGAANYHGPGGGGGGGVVITSPAIPGPQATVTGGAHGVTTVDANTYGSVAGAAGVVLATTVASVPGAGSGAECLPALAVTKTTSTPSVTNTSGGTTASYSITASNGAGLGTALGGSISDALPAGFTYASTVSIALNGGATQPAVVNPTVGDTNPTWGTFTIPGSGSVVITFTVDVAASVAPGTYSNPATATYASPTRTTAGATSSSGYPGGGVERVTVVAPDLTIAKSHVDPFTRGTTASYSLIATNSGNAPTSGLVTVTDTLPAGLTPTAASGIGWTCPAPAGQTVTCTRADALAAGAPYPAITVLVTVPQTAPASVTNQASVAGGGELDTANDTASDLTTIVSSADIAVAKSVSNATPNLGTNVTFTIAVSNNGPSDATGVQVTDLLPAGLTLVSATPSVGSYSGITGVWTIGGMTNGSSATLSVVATVTGTSPVTNTATKSAEVEPDPVAGNDASSVVVSGVSADVTVAKTVNRATPIVGQNVTYTLVGHNLGPSTAPGVQFRDTLPAGVAFVSDSATQGAYNPVTGIWNVGSMANGSTVTLTLVVAVNSSGAIVNTVTTLAGGYFDPNLSNNVSSAAIVASGLPGLPNTSAPGGSATAPPTPGDPVVFSRFWLAISLLVLGLSVLHAVATSARRSRARFGARRSRVRRYADHRVLGAGVVSGLLSVLLLAAPAGVLAPNPSMTAAAAPPGSELIGTKAVVVAPPVAPEAETFRTVAGPITPARIRIPALGVDAWIGAAGLLPDGSMDTPDNLWTASWLASGPRPGQAGSAVIAGHRGVGTAALFSHLEKLRQGDRIYVSDSAGNQVVYVVTGVASMDLSPATQLAVFGPTSAHQLVLITCFGRYVPSERSYDHRLVVFSQPASG